MDTNSPQNNPGSDGKPTPPPNPFLKLQNEIAGIEGMTAKDVTPKGYSGSTAPDTIPKKENPPLSQKPPQKNIRQINIPVRSEEIRDAIGHNLTEIAGKPAPYVTANGNTFNTLKAANAFITGEIPKEDPQKAIDALHNDTGIQSSHTIQSDLNESAKQKNTTVEDIFAAEALANQAKIKRVEDPRWGLYILGLSGVLVIGGILSLITIYSLKTEKPLPTPILVDPSVIIVTEATQTIYTNNFPLQGILLNTIKSQTPKGDKKIIRLTIKEGSESRSDDVNATRFSALLSAGLPTWMSRTFKPEYLAGLYDSPKGLQPVIIFKLTSYENAYAGMLKWEESMKTDLADLISIPTVRPEVTAPEISSTTPIKTTQKTLPKTITTASTTTLVNPVIKTGFRDVIIKNKDARVLEDSEKHRLIFYSFPDKETLVITTDQEALEEIFARLTTSKFVR